MEITYFAVGVLGFLAGMLITWLAMRLRMDYRELARRVDNLEKKETQHVASLQSARRHTHSTIAGIEDATALLIDLEIEAEAMKARLDTVRRILGKTREGPESYSNCEFGTTETQSSRRKQK